LQTVKAIEIQFALDLSAMARENLSEKRHEFAVHSSFEFTFGFDKLNSRNAKFGRPQVISFPRGGTGV
jgi:hypothetical protein